MARKSKQIILPHLNDCNGDVTKKWYVEYTVQHPQICTRIYDGFEKLSSANQRYAFADILIQEYTDKLNSGWRPYSLPLVEYEDALVYPDLTKMF